MNKSFYTLTLVSSFFLPTFVLAATLSLSAQPATVGVGQMVQVTLFVDSDIPVNAFSGTLSYPLNFLTPVATNDGDSIISAWITHPRIGTGDITFAGVTPGGFSGRKAVLFSVLFRTTAEAVAHLTLRDAQVLRNDGAGTNEPATIVPATITITQGSRATFAEPADTTPPEPFVLYLNHSPLIFGDQYYIAFAAVDKGSGVDHYDVAETRWPEWLIAPVWTRTDSPYLIRDQYLTSDVLIKAVDRAGNERTSVFPRQHFLRAREWLIVCGILALFVGVLWYRRRPET